MPARLSLFRRLRREMSTLAALRCVLVRSWRGVGCYSAMAELD